MLLLEFKKQLNFRNFPGCRWANGTCKLPRECAFAHGEKELEAWNEHLEKMGKERKMKTEEGKGEKTTGGHPKSSSNKVSYYECNYVLITTVFLLLGKGKLQLFLSYDQFLMARWLLPLYL